MSGPSQAGPAPEGIVNVLVVDDSAVVRQAMTTILSQDTMLHVETAPDPIFARQRMARTRFHVILLDLEMPRMDGLTFLRAIMAGEPIPVVVCSGFAAQGSRAALQALEEGAVAVVSKPSLGVRDFLQESAMMLIDTVRGAAQARVHRRAASPGPADRPSTQASSRVRPPNPPQSAHTTLRPRLLRDPLVVIGASTGGTEALRRILGEMPEDMPGIVIVQHMPDPFVSMFAQALDRSCAIEVRKAGAGDRVIRGRALIAPGNCHLVISRAGSGYRIELTDGPLVSRHRPSVDVLFRSAAKAAGAGSIGVLLTGMGSDGAEGLLEMRRAGAVTIAQDEDSCVVFGMPKEAIARGAALRVVPLDQVAGEIMTAAGGEHDTGPADGSDPGMTRTVAGGG